MGTGTSDKGFKYQGTPYKRVVVDEPQWASTGSLRILKDNQSKPTYQSNIIVLKPITRNHVMEFSWNELFHMLEPAGIEDPGYLGDYLGAVKKLGYYLKRWGRENLAVGLETHVWGPHLEPNMQVFFQKKSDMIKFKLAWVGL